MTKILRSVYLDPETDDELRALAFFFRCSQNELINWCLQYGLPTLTTLQRKTKDPETLVEQFKQGQLNTKFNRKLKAAYKRELKRLELAIEEVETDFADE